MARFKLTIEYAGTRFGGWQIQKNARTVQGEIAAAVRSLSERTDFELYGAGRTDAGVHALAQVAHLDLNTRLRAEALRDAVNDLLPADVHLLASEVVPRRFHARHDAVARSYLYQVSRRRTAFGKPYVWWVRDPLDVTMMSAALEPFRGMHDFASFAAKGGPTEGRSTRVLVERAELIEHGSLIVLRLQASHFLWRMVRRMVGIVVEAGRGGLRAGDVSHALAGASELPARFTAPASGLFLERVFYPGDVRDRPLRPAFAVD